MFYFKVTVICYMFKFTVTVAVQVTTLILMMAQKFTSMALKLMFKSIGVPDAQTLLYQRAQDDCIDQSLQQTHMHTRTRMHTHTHCTPHY